MDNLLIKSLYSFVCLDSGISNKHFFAEFTAINRSFINRFFLCYEAASKTISNAAFKQKNKKN